MATQTPNPVDLEEPEEESRPVEGGEMTLIEHLLELRNRVAWAGGAVVLGMGVFFIPPIGFSAVEWLLAPAIEQNPEFRAQAITPLENLFTYFRVALLGGIVLGMPMLVYQTVRFVSPALTPDEKRWMFPIVIGSSGAFLIGLLFAYYLVLPVAYGFLFAFGTSFADITPTISSYMDLTIRLMLILGIVFETPVVVMGLAKFGVVHWRRLLGWWRFAVVGAFIFSAVMTPTPDPITQTLIAGPMVILYFLGIGLAWMVRR